MNPFAKIQNRIFRDIRQNYIAFMILGIYSILTQWYFHTVCPFAILTGFPCPACGLTRAAILILTGQFTAAFQQNPTIYLWIPFLLYLFLFRYLLGKKPPFLLPLTILLCLVTIAVYTYRLADGNLVSVPCAGILWIVFAMF